MWMQLLLFTGKFFFVSYFFFLKISLILACSVNTGSIIKSWEKWFSFQSRALNGWARLVIGLLNRMYQEEELELRAKQLLYMRDREELLDEQLMSHKDITRHQTNVSLLQTNTLQLLQVFVSRTFKIGKFEKIWSGKLSSLIVIHTTFFFSLVDSPWSSFLLANRYLFVEFSCSYVLRECFSALY